MKLRGLIFKLDCLITLPSKYMNHGQRPSFKNPSIAVPDLQFSEWVGITLFFSVYSILIFLVFNFCDSLNYYYYVFNIPFEHLFHSDFFDMWKMDIFNGSAGT